MKKISKITLENFRVFSGKNEIDFNDTDGKPADLVCIYGKNGFGKTSLFDGFEWFFTGEIHLLNKELKKNVSKYKGNILKNKYAEATERAGIDILYSDGDKGSRIITNRKNAVNDSKVGNASGICKEMIDKKQILPHSRIDSFVYAVKPTELYNDWGDFWDPDNKQRDFFTAVYNVYKKFDNEVKEYDDKLKKIKNQLEELDIKRKVEDFNESVEKYNCLHVKNIPDLVPIEYDENEKIFINDKLFNTGIGTQINMYITNKCSENEQCEFLLNNFNEYKDFKKLQQEWLDRQDRCRRIIAKCQKKRELLSQIEVLEEQRKKLIESRDELLGVFDEAWFDEYQKNIELNVKYSTDNNKLNNSRSELENITSYIESLRQKAIKIEQQKNDVLKHWEEWKQQITDLNEKRKELFKEDVLKKLIEEKESADKQKQTYQKEVRYLNQAFTEGCENFLHSITADTTLEYPWIKEHVDYENKSRVSLTKAVAEEADAKSRYETMREEVDNLDELLTLAKREIQKSNSCTCPVCKSKFSNKDELLGKIDLSSQRTILLKLKTEWGNAGQKLKEAQEGHKKGIDSIQVLINDRICELNKLILKCENDIEQYQREYEERQLKIQKIKHEEENLKQVIEQELGTSIKDILKESVDTACSEKIVIISNLQKEKENEINEQQKKQRMVNTEIEQIEKILNDEKMRIDAFNNDLSNLEKQKIVQQRQIFSNGQFQSLVQKYVVDIQQNEDKKQRLQEELNDYKIYYTGNIDKYKKLLVDMDEKSIDRMGRYDQYKKTLFAKKQISKKTIIRYRKKIESEIEIAKEKLDIWNQCDSNVVVEQFINKYNQMFEEQGKLQQEKELCSQKQSLAEQIFKNVQSQMENHIKEAFGGVTINQIYSKIQPHKRFKQLQYQINMNEDSAPELYIKVKNDESEGIMPELFFSSAQLNTVALSVFLGGALSKSNPKVNTIFIDDPIGHFDDLNILSFIDVLRTIITETNWQIIISTHEENFYEVMKIKLNSKYYNSKFFKFKDEGNIEEDMEG